MDETPTYSTTRGCHRTQLSLDRVHQGPRQSSSEGMGHSNGAGMARFVEMGRPPLLARRGVWSLLPNVEAFACLPRPASSRQSVSESCGIGEARRRRRRCKCPHIEPAWPARPGRLSTTIGFIVRIRGTHAHPHFTSALGLTRARLPSEHMCSCPHPSRCPFSHLACLVHVFVSVHVALLHTWLRRADHHVFIPLKLYGWGIPVVAGKEYTLDFSPRTRRVGTEGSHVIGCRFARSASGHAVV